MAITREQAKEDLEKVMKQFDTLGNGSERDRAAQLVMQSLGVLERRIGKKGVIEMLYVNNPEASKLLPPTAYETAKQYAEGSIDETQARERLKEASKQYEDVFREMGIKPKESSMLFGKL